MAATQLLSLIISAIDKATAPIKSIQGALEGLSKSASVASNASSGLSGAIGIGGMAQFTPLQTVETEAMFLFMGAMFYLAWRWK